MIKFYQIYQRKKKKFGNDLVRNRNLIKNVFFLNRNFVEKLNLSKIKLRQQIKFGNKKIVTKKNRLYLSNLASLLSQMEIVKNEIKLGQNGNVFQNLKFCQQIEIRL